MYDTIAKSYNELYGEEQLNKWKIIETKLDFSNYSNALDVGCGTGLITVRLSDRVHDVVGIDKSIEMLKLAEPRPNITYLTADALNLPFDNKSFDLVISVTVMQDVGKENWEKFLKEIYRVAKKDVVISILKRNKSLDELKSVFERYFDLMDVVEEEKDYIFFLRRVI